MMNKKPSSKKSKTLKVSKDLEKSGEITRAKSLRKPRTMACSMEHNGYNSPTPKAPTHSYRSPIYRPVMCDEIQAYYAQGMSDIQVCAKLGICKDTFYVWVKEIPEFGESVRFGKVQAQAWWEAIGQRASDGSIKSDSKIWYVSMKNRYGYRDNPCEAADIGVGAVVRELQSLVALHKKHEAEY